MATLLYPFRDHKCDSLLDCVPQLLQRSFVSQHDIAGGLPPACRREAERRLAEPPASRSTLLQLTINSSSLKKTTKDEWSSSASKGGQGKPLLRANQEWN